jgi:hypothetical protein
MSNLKFRELVGIAIGEASMCWSEVPSGVFQSEKALALLNRICEAHDAENARLRGALELFVNEAVTPDGCGGYFWTDARIVDAIEAAKDALKSPPHPASATEEEKK